MLAFMGRPRTHLAKIQQADPPSRPHTQIKRRINVAGIFSNHAAVERRFAAVLIEHFNGWAVTGRHTVLKTAAQLAQTDQVAPPAIAVGRLNNAPPTASPNGIQPDPVQGHYQILASRI